LPVRAANPRASPPEIQVRGELIEARRNGDGSLTTPRSRAITLHSTISTSAHTVANASLQRRNRTKRAWQLLIQMAVTAVVGFLSVYGLLFMQTPAGILTPEASNVAQP
jgi:hypothetical protein